MKYKPIILLSLISLAILPFGCSQSKKEKADSDDFTGSTTCRQCHEKFYELWSTSHHGLAMQPFTDTFASNALTAMDTPIKIGQQSFKADIASRTLTEEGTAGRTTHAMAHAMGGKNVYYFLTPLERGRLQVLPLAYDVQSNEWFNTASSMVRHFGDMRDTPLDWRDPMLTFNTACFGCHVSQLAKNYDLKTDTYNTVWREPGINCETCHGPCGEHVRVCLAAPTNTIPTDLKLIRQKAMTMQQRDDNCAPCHAKMRPITAGFTPGQRFFDHYDLTTFEDQDFYPDGRDLGENYTYTQWLTSPCVKAGKLECIHCHTSSGRFRFAGEKSNEACLPCHQERVKNAIEHTHHDEGSKGSRCISCHMPMTTFARMRRSDHSMRPPTPAATIAFKSPNACNLCHINRDAYWANGFVKEWRTRDYQAPVLYRANLIDSAKKRDWRQLDDMLKFIGDEKSDNITVVSLIRLLAACEAPAKWPVIRKALKNTSPLVRSAAATTLSNDPSRETFDGLITATADDYRLVRISAAASLARYASSLLDPKCRKQCDSAFKELENCLMGAPDSWSSHYNIGNYYEERHWTSQALASYEQSMKLRPDVILPIVNASMLYARQGNMKTAMNLLRKALAIEPNNPAVNFNLALALAEQNNIADAEKHLRIALTADSSMAQAAYNLGVILNRNTVCEEGIKWCKRAVELMPNNRAYTDALKFYLDAQKQKTRDK